MEFSKNVMWLVIIGGFFYVIGQYVASQPARSQQEVEAGREIVVQGSAELLVKPDVARLSVSVQTGPQTSAPRALQLLTERALAVVAAITSGGVEEKDIKTTNLALHPQYDFLEGRQVLRGFEAMQTIQVTIRDLDNIGAVLAATTSAGANQAGDLQIEVDDPSELQQQAQELAIKDARESAEQLAKALGVSLGDVKSFADNSVNQPIFARAAVAELDSFGPAVPVGENVITSQVSVTFSIK